MTAANSRICVQCGGVGAVRYVSRDDTGAERRRLRCGQCGERWWLVGHLVSLQTYRRRPVECVESGEVFSSMTAAARDVFVTRETMRGAVRFGHRAGGVHWRYLNPPQGEQP